MAELDVQNTIQTYNKHVNVVGTQMTTKPLSSRFSDVLTEEQVLRQLLGNPSALEKSLHHLDPHAKNFIAHSPFALLGTASGTGAHDVSPRGVAPGFVIVLDDNTLVIPERPGNRRADTMRNVLQTGQIGILFVVPGVGETLRVNGKACLVRDANILERTAVAGKRALFAIAVDVEETFLHCAKAFKRSKLWQAETWPPPNTLPSLAKMLVDQLHPVDTTVAQLEQSIAESYVKRLY